MPAVKPVVKLLQHTGNPEQTVAVAAKLCYSDATIQELAEGLTPESTAKFIKRLASMGHASPVEHASFTFGIEGVSRAFLAQITRHRIASFSVKSQRTDGNYAWLVCRLAGKTWWQRRKKQRRRSLCFAKRKRNKNGAHNERTRTFALFQFALLLSCSVGNPRGSVANAQIG